MHTIESVEHEIRIQEEYLNQLRRELEKVKSQTFYRDLYDIFNEYQWYQPYEISEDTIYPQSLKIKLNSNGLINWNGVADRIHRLGYHLHSIHYETRDNRKRTSEVIIKRN